MDDNLTLQTMGLHSLLFVIQNELNAPCDY